MAKDIKYIRKRKRKYGCAFLVDIPYVDEDGNKKHFTETVRLIDFRGDEKAALTHAKKVRNEALLDIESGKLRRIYPTVKTLYSEKWNLIPLSLSTHEKQNSIYKQSVINLENKFINDVTATDIQLQLNEYAISHSDDGVKRLLTIWRQIYKAAHLLGYDIYDQTLSVIRPASKIVVKKKPVDVNLHDIKAVMDELLRCNDSEMYDRRCIWFILSVMYYTGMRPSEVFALHKDDITTQYIDINKRIGSTISKKQMIVPAKTESSNRHVPLTPDLLDVLVSALSWSKHEYIFMTESGEFWDVDRFSEIIYRVALKAGVHFNAYMLRHLMSTDLLHRGDSVVARDLLGHTSFSMTLDYARSTDSQIRKAMIERSAELQPKNKSHEQPRTSIKKLYQIYRLSCIVRFLAVFKGVLD